MSEIGESIFSLTVNEKPGNIHYLAEKDKTRMALNGVTIMKITNKLLPPFDRFNGKFVAMATDGFVLGLRLLECEGNISKPVIIPTEIWKMFLKETYWRIEETPDRTFVASDVIRPIELDRDLHPVEFESVLARAGRNMANGQAVLNYLERHEKDSSIVFGGILDMTFVDMVIKAFGKARIKLSPTHLNGPYVYDYSFAKDIGYPAGIIMPVTEKE